MTLKVCGCKLLARGVNIFPEPDSELKEKLEMYELPDVIFLLEKVDKVNSKEIVGTRISFQLLIRQIVTTELVTLKQYIYYLTVLEVGYSKTKVLTGPYSLWRLWVGIPFSGF